MSARRRPVDELAARRAAKLQRATEDARPRTVLEALKRADALLLDALGGPLLDGQLLVDGEAVRDLVRQVDHLVIACIQAEQPGEVR